MSLSQALFQSAAAVLLLCLAYRHPAVARLAGRRGLVLAIAGALVPLADFAVFFARSPDRIAMLTQTPLFSGLFFGLGALAVGAALAAFATGPRAGGRVLAFGTAGFLAHLALALVTPGGAPLWEPFAAARVALPAFGGGHPLLLVLLAVALLGTELMRRWERAWFRGSVAVVAFYFAAGFAQYAYVSVRAGALAAQGGRLAVEPANGWFTHWLVTVAGDERYRTLRYRLGQGALPAGEQVERWNDQTLLLRMLDDPIVRHFYFRVFRQPVVHTATTGDHTTLVMQELKTQHLLAGGGRTFFLELDREANSRLYRVAGFD